MYRKHPKGREYEINNIKVNIPPNGYVYNIITNQWEKREILARSVKKDYQYWRDLSHLKTTN